MAKVNLVAELKKHLASITPEQAEQEWKELEKYNYGPTVEEYIQNLKDWGLYK